MVASVEIIDGKLKELLGETKIEFKDFNIIYGSNGIGKSLLIKSIAEKCLIDDLGFSDIKNFDSQKYSHYKKQYARASTIKVDWDMSDCFFIGDYHIQDWHTNAAYEMSSGERVSGINFIKKWQNNLSSGQMGLSYLEDVFKITPTIKLDKLSFYDKEEFLEQFKGKSIGKRTYIFDEIDSHLNLENQYKTIEFLKEKSIDYQIIIISHSPVIYANKYINDIIDIDKSYEKNKSVLQSIL